MVGNSDIRHSGEANRGKNYSKNGNVENHFQNRKRKEFKKDLNQVTTSQEIKSNPNAQNLGDPTPSLFANLILALMAESLAIRYWCDSW